MKRESSWGVIGFIALVGYVVLAHSGAIGWCRSTGSPGGPLALCTYRIHRGFDGADIFHLFES